MVKMDVPYIWLNLQGAMNMVYLDLHTNLNCLWWCHNTNHLPPPMISSHWGRILKSWFLNVLCEMVKWSPPALSVSSNHPLLFLCAFCCLSPVSLPTWLLILHLRTVTIYIHGYTPVTYIVVYCVVIGSHRWKVGSKSTRCRPLTIFSDYYLWWHVFLPMGEKRLQSFDAAQWRVCLISIPRGLEVDESERAVWNNSNSRVRPGAQVQPS